MEFLQEIFAHLIQMILNYCITFIQNVFTIALDCGETQAVGPQYYNGVKCTLKMIFMLIHLRFFSKFFGASLIGMLVQKN